MKFNADQLKICYEQSIGQAISKENERQGNEFLRLWKDKWVGVLTDNGYRYGKLEKCDVQYNLDRDKVLIHAMLSLPNEESIFPTGTEIVEMTPKQLIFLKMQNLIECTLVYDDSNECIRGLVSLLSPSDIKEDENID